MSKKLKDILTSYEKRKRDIQFKECELRDLLRKHTFETKRDLGCADGEVMDVSTLSKIIEVLIKLNSKDKNR